MKPTIYKLILFVLFTAFISWIRCSVDPLSPQALLGRWMMLNLTDKEENITINAGEPIDIGDGETRTMRGWLSFDRDFENESFIWISIFMTTTIPGEGEQYDSEATSGTYSINESTLTIFDVRTGDTKVFGISRSKLRLTLEDDESQTTWGKID